MRFGIFPYILLAFVLILGGAFAWLAFTHVPVEQHEIIVNVPVGGAS